MTVGTLRLTKSIEFHDPMPGVQVVELEDPFILLIRNNLTRKEVVRRISEDHTVFGIYLHQKMIGHFWVARGEINQDGFMHRWVLPYGHRFIWDVHLSDEELIYLPTVIQLLIGQCSFVEQLWIILAGDQERILTLSGFKKIPGSIFFNKEPQSEEVIDGLII